MHRTRTIPPRPAPAPQALTAQELFDIGRLLRCLSSEFWLPASALALDLSMSERGVRECVHRASEYGIPVVSGNRGYKIGGVQEAEACIRRLESHAKKELARVAGLRRYIESQSAPGAMFSTQEGTR